MIIGLMIITFFIHEMTAMWDASYHREDSDINHQSSSPCAAFGN
jgi:hypothetical protein